MLQEGQVIEVEESVEEDLDITVLIQRTPSEHLLMYVTGELTPENVLTTGDIFILQLLMSKIIGTGAQRGSITRIIGTLRDQMAHLFPSPLLKQIQNENTGS